MCIIFMTILQKLLQDLSNINAKFFPSKITQSLTYDIINRYTF